MLFNVAGIQSQINSQRICSRFNMNFRVKCLLLLSILMIFACRAEIQRSEAVIRNGIVYQKGDKKPFTGFVTGRGREGYRRQIYRYQKQYEDGILNGMTKFWYPNGKLESVEPYENGQINGHVIRYYRNGQMKARIPMRNGMRSGGAGELFWDKNGNLIKG
jgi:antitoxin component YwqK of YwqJK toxin-antitoxin module